MLGRILFSAVIISVLLIGTARAQQRAPTPQEINDIEALVTKAAALVESKGKEAAFAEFGKRNQTQASEKQGLFRCVSPVRMMRPLVNEAHRAVCQIGVLPDVNRAGSRPGGPAQQPIFFKGAIKTIRRGFAVSNSVSRGWTNEPKNFYWSS
jgi:hypothetical protein